MYIQMEGKIEVFRSWVVWARWCTG